VTGLNVGPSFVVSMEHEKISFIEELKNKFAARK
jgi:hypothetical protein